jgi:predicted nucleic acid-binding protein
MADNPVQYSRPYLDSSVYIAAINKETIAGANGVERWKIARQILKEAEQGRFRIRACTLIAAEVVKVPGDHAPLKESDDAVIDGFLRNAYIEMVEVDLALAVRGRQIARKYGLRPVDAIHVAAALETDADILLRWDKKWPTGDYDGVPVRDPYWWGQGTLEV